MPFQRSYSKVWWGSDNQLPAMSSLPAQPVAGSSFTSGGYYYSCHGNHSNRAPPHHPHHPPLQQDSSHLRHQPSVQPSSYFLPHQQNQHQQQQQQQSRQFHHFNGHNSSGGYHSLDYNNLKSYGANLSRIQEVDDEHNISKLSWGKRDSPGSLRSQDSGFSDNDDLHSTRSLGGRSSKTSSPSSKSNRSIRSMGSPSPSTRSVATPPTVIRRVGKSEFFSPLVNISRRISFSGSPSSLNNRTEQEVLSSTKRSELPTQLTDEQLVGRTAKKLNFGGSDSMEMLNTSADEIDMTPGAVEVSVGDHKHRRRRRISRTPTKPLTPTKRRSVLDENRNNGECDGDDDDANENGNENTEDCNLDEAGMSAKVNRSRCRHRSVPEYNNETVYLGAVPHPYNNETVFLGGGDVTIVSVGNDELMSPLKGSHSPYTASTSTPKATGAISFDSSNRPHLFATHEYENPLLNGHDPALQCWLDDLRSSYDHEVMSTLQTKSIAQEAFKNLTITTNTVAKLIRQLQQRALDMQSDFERIERILTGVHEATLHQALSVAGQLIANVDEFTKVLERRAVFFSDSRFDRKRYEDSIEQIRSITRDTRYSLERRHYISLESLLDDVQVLKRYLLISIRLVFEKMVRVIVQSVEQGRCDLMLRANINMIATLTNIDYEGFASLTDAFVQNEAVRALLIVCLENRISSVRALALRALATICCAPAAIAQLGACGGIEIVRDILQVQAKDKEQRMGDDSGNANENGDDVGDDARTKRGDIERREAVSLLTQITAAWHGPDHRVDGLRACAETIVEGLTQLVGRTMCPQTLLLCAAALNNLSRMEVTSHYSIMSNETIFRLIEAVERKEDGTCILFLYEQIVAMLHNMSLNKKCHSHLANGSIINFITSAYQTEFYKSYNSRAESEAQRRTIKAILHTLTHLVHESSFGAELLDQQRIPAFFKMAILGGGGGGGGGGDHTHSQLSLDNVHSRDISMLARQMLLAQQRERKELLPQMVATGSEAVASSIELDSKAAMAGLKFNLTRHESFV